MANIINNNFNNLKIKLNTDDYWDFFICKDILSFDGGIEDMDENGCLISYIDASDEECIEGKWIKGKKNYTWQSGFTSDYTLENIGYTGFDNGLFCFRKDRIMNSDFVKLYTETNFHNEDDTMVLHLHQVSGSTLQYDYPISIENGSIRCNGGFYQGYFETQCDEYAILPSQIEDEWNFEFQLKKSDLEAESNKTLNDKYPDNKGIFFYIGTRAENKWIYLYDDTEDECDDLGIQEYVEGGDIDTKNYGLTNFLDTSITFPKTYFEAEAFTLMDYISYKYYDNQEYFPSELDKDKFFIDDYVILTDKPNIIDETKPNSAVIWGGCDMYNNYNMCADDDNKPIEEYIVTCSGKKQMEINEENLQYMKGWYSEKNIFDDVEDLDIFDGETEYVEPDIDISDFEYTTAEGFELKFSKQYTIKTDNKFLFFNRTCTGFTVHNWEEGSIVELQGRKTFFDGNLFIMMNRTCTGLTVRDIECLENSQTQSYDICNDLYNNALAFRIKDNGSIGYRYYALDCDTDEKCVVKEGYSKEDIIKEDEWYDINVKIINLNNKVMKLYFYVNGKLKFISNELPLLHLRVLNDIAEKQEGVPYNISLGGGTQGLIETILPNYMRNPYRVYPLEKNFAGSFIGYIKTFRFFQCPMKYTQILYNFQKRKIN